jgi:protein O-mannosyl-transferase
MARRSRSTTSQLPVARTDGVIWAQICYAAVLGLIIAIVYGPSVSTPFIFDDVPGIVQNPSLFRLWPLLGSAPHFAPLNPPRLSPTSGRPLVNLSFAINYQLGGLNPVGYHLFNLMLHWLSAILLMGIVRRTLQLEFFRERFGNVAIPLGFLAALVWALHPLQTETVVYVTQRTELSVAFFIWPFSMPRCGAGRRTARVGLAGWRSLSQLVLRERCAKK